MTTQVEVPSLSSAELLTTIEQTPGLRALVHVSSDGIPLAHAGDACGHDLDSLAALASSLYALGRSGGEFVGPGALPQTILIDYPQGPLVVASAPGSVLAGLGGEATDPGDLGLVLTKLARRLDLRNPVVV
ncbi:roadblock/LC7 domain-containing protein [Kitasatospora sp. NPDC004240]